MLPRVEDKVRVKNGAHGGLKGKVVKVTADLCSIAPSTGGEAVTVNVSDLTNYSSAARKAWLKMPVRNVGRPAGSTRQDRVSVTFRVDRELWQSFLEAEHRGGSPGRNELIDGMVQNYLSLMVQNTRSGGER